MREITRVSGSTCTVSRNSRALARLRTLGALAAIGLGAVLAPASAAAGSDEPATEPTVPVPVWDEAPVDEGAVTVVGNDRQPLSNGGSSTAFSLDLPEGAACPGDSASQNWYVQSFLIPATDDPGTIKYGVIGPEGTQFPLFAFDTRPYAHQLTQVSGSPDAPGIIASVPELSFAVFEPGYIPPGRYRIGIACTFFRQTARYWDTEIVIEADPADSPAQLTWRLPDAEAFVPPGDGLPVRWLAIAAILLGGAGTALWLVRSGAKQSRAAAASDGATEATSDTDDHPESPRTFSRSPR